MAANESRPGEPTSGLDASLGVEGQYTSIFTRQSDETLKSWNRITSVSAGVWGVGLYLSLRVPTFVGTLLVLLTALLTLLFACVLIVLVSRGLPSERIETAASSNLRALEPVRFVFSRASVAMALACVLLAALLITIAGIGVGMRKTGAGLPQPYASGPMAVAGNSPG